MRKIKICTSSGLQTVGVSPGKNHQAQNGYLANGSKQFSTFIFLSDIVVISMFKKLSKM